MRPSILIRLLALIAAATPPLAGQARPVATLILDHGAKELTDPFSQLFGLRELRNGQVIALDMKEKELRLVDFARDAVSPVSRIGQGPLEYQVPGILLDGAKDSVLYYDVGQHRFLVLSPTGKPTGTSPFGSTDVAATFSQMAPATGDATGHVFGQTLGVSMPTEISAPEAPTFTDSVDIMSLDRRTGKTTKLARIRNAAVASQPKIEMVGMGIKMTMAANDFRASDVWAALPNGRVAILRDGTFRIHFVGAGAAETLGPLVASTPIPVTATERKGVVDSARKFMGTMVETMRKQMGGAAGGPTFDIQVVEPKSWATVKPAYLALQSSPDGRLWVSPSVPAGTKGVRFEVLDGTGALIAHVQLAPGETIAGLGRGTVYTIRTDEDGLQHLRRYAVVL